MIMATYVNRQIYLQKLIHRRDNGEVKIITGLVDVVSRGF